MPEIPAIKDRSHLLANLRSELVGPSLYSDKATEASMSKDGINIDEEVRQIFVKNPSNDRLEEVLYDRNEGPTRKYGVGVLHPDWSIQKLNIGDEQDGLGYDEVELNRSGEQEEGSQEANGINDRTQTDGDGADDDVDLSPANRYKQSSMGVSFCVRLPRGSGVKMLLPSEKKFEWQLEDDEPFPVNGLYQNVEVKKTHEKGQWKNTGAWRTNAFPVDCEVPFSADELTTQRYLLKDACVVEGSPQKFDVVVRARDLGDDEWLITITLRNRTETAEPRRCQFMLFQSYFEVRPTNGAVFLPYPDPPQSSFEDLERESLKLLYSNSKTWAIGHNCAAGWQNQRGEGVTSVFADVFPVHETASMTPDIADRNGNRLQFEMRELADLDASGKSEVWKKLELLESEYRYWIEKKEVQVTALSNELQVIGARHLTACNSICDRILEGINTLKSNENARLAFRLANKAMMLQQIATKVLPQRKLKFNRSSGDRGKVEPEGDYASPFQKYESTDLPPHIGKWRAFQLAFLLMNVPDFLNEGQSKFEEKRENVELIWFPTGGGKTEAYLGVAAYSMFLARLIQGDREKQGEEYLPVDGTNILMRYTLRMLTTQQFQRAAALICSMECLRHTFKEKEIVGGEFSLGLWIGGSSTPNKNQAADDAVKRYRNKSKSQENNPLILTECPWCRAEIGRADIPRPKGWAERDWKSEVLKGVLGGDEPKVCCSDVRCRFQKSILPIKVVDEQIYDSPPSLVIATADKFAVISYRPKARAIFGRDNQGNVVKRPPFLIIQDETHLISGPLGTMFGLYEGVIEELCTFENEGVKTKPKIVCSTATIRGAKDQLEAIFARDSFTLFPSPGVDISDSFFGCYAREDDGVTLQPGRMYVGVHAAGFVSAQTTQVRVYSSLLVNVENHIPEERRDPWWTILCFYNSLRELGGAMTLFQGDIRSRMRFLTLRDNLKFRKDPLLKELSSRLKQDEIVAMLDWLNAPYPEKKVKPIDVCLASNIIEVGVDIDRLSLMTVVGQPKNTAQYIQVTGRVGRRWNERPGLICTIYSGTKIRDKSHFEQFYSYHSRLYEQVEPTTATPFSRASLERAVVGAMILYARCVRPYEGTARYADYETALEEAKHILIARCKRVETLNSAKQVRIIDELFGEMKSRWAIERDQWEKFSLGTDDSVLMRWPGQYATVQQENTTFEIPSSLRQVDKSGELAITKHYS